MGSLCKIPRTVFDERAPDGGLLTFEDLSEEHKDAALELKNSVAAQNWIIRDYTVAPVPKSSLTALFNDVRKMHEQERIQLFIIDPFWPLVLRTADSMGLGGDDKQLRAVGMAMAEQINKFCKELSIPIILVHQLSASGAEGSAGGRKKPSMYAAAEIRTLGWRFENVAIITYPDDDNNLGLVRGKSRNSGVVGQMIMAHFDGATNSFERIQGANLFQQGQAQNVQGRDLRDVAEDLAGLAIQDEEE
jgi:hypothetical protein